VGERRFTFCNHVDRLYGTQSFLRADNALACQEMFLPMEPKGLLSSLQKPKPVLIKFIPIRRFVHLEVK
jgi:hypothetical protein